MCQPCAVAALLLGWAMAGPCSGSEITLECGCSGDFVAVEPMAASTGSTVTRFEAGGVPSAPSVVPDEVRWLRCVSQNRLLVGSARRIRPGELYEPTRVSLIDGSGTRQLVDEVPGCVHVQAAVRPGGQQYAVAVACVDKTSYRGTSIQVMDFEGKLIRRRQLQPLRYVSNMRWSPDGSRLAVALYDLTVSGDKLRRRRHVYVFTADLAAHTVFQGSPDAEAALAWAPDGSKLIFSALGASAKDRNPALFMADSEGRAWQVWAGARASQRCVSVEWLPGEVVFLLRDDRDGSVTLTRLDDRTFRRVSALSIDAASTPVRLCPDGQMFVGGPGGSITRYSSSRIALPKGRP